MTRRANSFVDGAYLRARAAEKGLAQVDPHSLSFSVMRNLDRRFTAEGVRLSGVTYFDGRPDEDDEASSELLEYWEKIRFLDDTHLGFGMVRGQRPRQKGVDTLIAVRMLKGAYDGTYDIAILISGDADFVPVIEEVRSRGVAVVLGAFDDRALSQDLRAAADRTIYLETVEWSEI